MYSEPLKAKLREANITPANPFPQLKMRAAAQINTYVGLLNARLAASEDEGARADVVEVLTQVRRISGMAMADPLC